MKYQPPERDLGAFHCPHCRAYAQQEWWYNAGVMSHGAHPNPGKNPIALNRCTHCGNRSLWWWSSLLHPAVGVAPPPNPDLPAQVKELYEEAAAIAEKSPRGAAALLRLAIHHLTLALGGWGKNINADIGILVSRGLPASVQQALNIVRVVGNNAVAPGQIDADDAAVVRELFTLTNLIAEYMITMPGRVNHLFGQLPTETRSAAPRGGKGSGRPA
jgi:hypothetical protein